VWCTCCGRVSGTRPGKDWDKIATALKPIYTASTLDQAEERFLEFSEAWGKKYPAIVRLWESAWAEFVPFLQFDAEIRRIVCTTNAIESVNEEDPQSRPRPGPLPERASRPEMCVPRGDEPGSDRPGTGPLESTLEGSTERLRHHLQRPTERRTLTQTKTSYTELLTHPSTAGRRPRRICVTGRG